MPQYLYRIQPSRHDMLANGPTEREAAIVAEHFDYLRRLVEGGPVLMAGRTLVTDERCFGIVIFEAPSDAEATALMQNDPAVREGVMHAELFPYSIVLWSSKAPSRQ